jgi:hydrogenase nickel incorporation protein HypB
MARYAIINKVDLLPHVPFDIDLAETYARSINPGLQFFRTSAVTGEGLDQWFGLLRSAVRERCPT